MKIRIFGPVTLALILAIVPFCASAQQGDDPLVATVNGEKIYRSEVLETAESLPPQYQQQLDEVFPALVNRLVDFRLLAVAAAGLAKDEEVLSRLAELEQNIIREVYLERKIDERVTDEALRGRYDKMIAENPAEPEVHARHILLEDEAAAKEVIVALDGGADFAELASERSTGPSGPQGGDLGYFTQEQMVPEFAQVAFAMEAGSYTNEPVQTQFG
jgi:peptidyl-prolyl cis-trans isomerase C